MIWKHICVNVWTQPFWLCWMWYLIHRLIFFPLCSLDLSVLGWYVEDNFSLTPVSLCNTHQTFERKGLWLSETMSFHSPFSQYQWLKNKSVSSSAIIFVCVGITCTSEHSLSVMDSMQSKPLSSGSGPIKYMATLSPQLSRTCSGFPSWWFVVLAVSTQANVSLLKVPSHIWPVISITQCCVQFGSSEVSQDVMCEMEQFLPNVPCSWDQ